MNSIPPIAKSLSTKSRENERTVKVTLSNTLIQLLSEQLYQSPLKAIEELVVNAYDANAKICRIFVPLSTDDKERDFIVVYDDGHGMDYTGLTDLWLVGRSKKRTKEIERRSKRKQIGKFGIGKLATSTIAHQLTYISKSLEGILGVTIDFKDFQSTSKKSAGESTNQGGKSNIEQENLRQADQIKPINLPVYEIKDMVKFYERGRLGIRC